MQCNLAVILDLDNKRLPNAVLVFTTTNKKKGKIPTRSKREPDRPAQTIWRVEQIKISRTNARLNADHNRKRTLYAYIYNNKKCEAQISSMCNVTRCGTELLRFWLTWWIAFFFLLKWRHFSLLVEWGFPWLPVNWDYGSQILMVTFFFATALILAGAGDFFSYSLLVR